MKEVILTHVREKLGLAATEVVPALRFHNQKVTLAIFRGAIVESIVGKTVDLQPLRSEQ